MNQAQFRGYQQRKKFIQQSEAIKNIQQVYTKMTFFFLAG